MSPLIEIKNIPIEIEMKISHAKLEYTHGTADLEISRGNKGLQVKGKPIQINMDTFEAQNQVRPVIHTAEQSCPQNDVHSGRRATYEATASYAGQGQLLLKAKVDQQLLTQFAASKHSASEAQAIHSEVFVENQNAKSDTSELNIRFEMDKLNFDWKLNASQFEFTPGDIEFSVAQRPEVVITYIGGPIYVPPSSDPDYTPVDTQA